MTDNEIIRALENYSFKTQALFEAIKLIKSQKAEIERLQKTQDDIDNFARDLCEERMLKGKAIADFEDLQEYIRKEKSEAIREFAERLKDYLRQQPKWNVSRDKHSNVGFSYDIVFFGIDHIVKEMEECENG